MPIWKWYGVKTVYRLEPSGRPEATDRDYWGEGGLVEERVVVFRARSFAEATRKAEKEADSYARQCNQDKDRNPYGQPLVLRYLGSCDAYEMTEEALKSGAEVFSMTELIRRSVSDDAVLDRRLGPEESTRDMARRRKNFCLLMLNGAVPGVKPTEAERAELMRIRLFLRNRSRE